MLSIRIRSFSFACVSLACVAVMSQMLAPSHALAKGGGLVGLEGVLTSIDSSAGTLIIRSRRGQSVTIATTATTKIERNDRRATLAMFKLGDRVEAKLPSATSVVAVKVEAVGP